jgi:Flp pilus assembly protein TadG
MRGLIRYVRNQDGTSAVEFALVLIPLLVIIMGLIGLCIVMYFNATMQHSVEDSARWASIQTTVNSGTAPTSTAVQSHFSGRYIGPTIDTFTYSPAATAVTCSSAGTGTQTFHRVYAHAVYNLNAVLGSIPFDLQASACFP